MQPTSQVHGNTANSTPHLSRFSRHVPPQGMESDGFRGIWVPQFHQARLRKFKSEEMEARMEGKNCIVTGANSGLGYATAEGLASRYVIFPLSMRSSHLHPDFLQRICLFMSWLTVPACLSISGSPCQKELMLPLLEKVAPDAQVITVSSAGMYTSPLTTDLE